MFKKDHLEFLSGKNTASQKLEALHKVITTYNPDIDRVAVALYEPALQTIKTYIESDSSGIPFEFYEIPLSDAPGLIQVKDTRECRVINDLDIFNKSRKGHSKLIARKGLGSSYTFPMYRGEEFIGFIFFNSLGKNKFQFAGSVLLDVFSHLITDIIYEEIVNTKTMLAAFRSASELVHYRDPETGNHLERMAHYSKLIARELSKENLLDFSDEAINYLFTFAPLHDLGKIAIPDNILLKAGKLTDDEWEIMKNHTLRGGEMLINIMKTFSLKRNRWTTMLANIVELHHEFLDGSGYPHGKRGSEVPFEARIVTVSDIFDALTSKRPYKEAWSNEEAFAELNKMAKAKLDPNCIRILENNKTEVIRIQKAFQD